MSNHTPGPWNIEDGDVIAEIGPHVASITTADDLPCIEDSKYGEVSAECDANARLISAAPDLLEACEAMVRFYEMIDWDGGSDTVADAHEDRIEQIRTAIKKASGE